MRLPSPLRRTALRSLSRLGLVQTADNLRLARGLLRDRRANAEFRTAHPDFALPPPLFIFQTWGKTNWARYRHSGLEVASVVARIAERHNLNPMTVVEWGCGPGRVIRHFPELFPAARILGSDYNPRFIDWCKENVDGVEFQTNGAGPPLAYEDAEVDLLFSHSVFTHLSPEMHDAWIAELRRVIRPNGMLVVTLAGERFRAQLSAADQARFDRGELVTSSDESVGEKYYSALHSPAYVRNRLLADWEVLEHLTDRAETTVGHDIWVARRP